MGHIPKLLTFEKAAENPNPTEDVMGDRTYCSLYCYRDTPLTEEESARLTKALKNELPSEIEDNFAGFHEINYGEMPSDIGTPLEEMGISFSWYHGNGDSYNSGVYIFDALTQESDSFNTIDSQIVITVDCTPEELEHARSWYRRFEGRTPLVLPKLD
jgi:hypothetical protein